MSHHNASGSTKIQKTINDLEGFEDEWIFTRYVNYEDPTGAYNFSDAVYVQRSYVRNPPRSVTVLTRRRNSKHQPNQTLDDTKFRGCNVNFANFVTTAQLPLKDDGSCSGVFGAACLAEIQKNISAISYARDKPPCYAIQEAILSAYKSPNCNTVKWSLSGADADISLEGVNDGILLHAFESHDFSVTKSSGSSKSEDFEDYDLALGIPLPFAFAVAQADEDGDIIPSSVTPMLVCIPADKIEDGSRKLPEPPISTTTTSPSNEPTGAAIGRADGIGRGAFAVAGLTVLLSVRL